MSAEFEQGSYDEEITRKFLRSTLRQLNSQSDKIEASAVVTVDGILLASVLSESVDQDRFGAMCASLLALADRAAQEIARGVLRQVLIEGDQGVMLLVYAGREAVLAVAAESAVHLGMLFIEAQKVAIKIKQTMDGK